MKNAKLKNSYIRLNQKNRLYGLTLPLIGLTGGIASGKSSVSDILRQLGMGVICADQLIKAIYELPQTHAWLRENVSTTIIEANNLINFKKLRELFFGDMKLQNKLENFLYPQLENVFLHQLEMIISDSNVNKNFIFYDVPLLFEKKMEGFFDLNILTYASPSTQIQRLIARDKIDEKLAQEILSKQLPIETKRKSANFIIENDHEKDKMPELVNSLLQNILDFNL